MIQKFLLLSVSIFSLIIISACTKKVEEKGMVMNIATTAKLKGMDPAQAQDLYSGREIIRVYECLLQYHPYKRPYVLEPLLADGMPTISKNGLVYTFKVRKGVFFHNDAAFPEGKGREMTAEDVVYSLKRLADPKSGSTGWWILEGRVVGLDEWRKAQQEKKDETQVDYSSIVPGLKTLDKYTLQVQLKAPFPQFLYALAMPYASVVAKEVVDKYGKEFINHPVGTGPFIVEKFNTAEGVTYVKNPNYWPATFPSEGEKGDKEAGLLDDAGKQIPFLDRINVRVIVEDQPRWLHFMRGEIDTTGIPKDNFKQAITAEKELTPELKEKGIKLTQAVSMDLTYTAFNIESTEIPQFRDKRVRQAISLALDEKEAIATFYNGMATAAQTVIPPGIPGYNPEFKNPYRTNDIEKAKKLLAAAGYPDGKGFPEITYDTMADTTSRQMSEYVGKNLAKIGLKIKVNSNTWPAFMEKIQRRQTQLWGIAWGADYPDAENFLQLFYTPNAQPGGMNGSYYKNKNFDKIFEKARVMQDSPARTKLYKELAEILAEDTPVILGVHRISMSLSQSWVKNDKYQEFQINLAKYLKIDTEIKKKYRK